MKQYIELMQEVLEDGTETKDRTGVGTISKFGITKEYPVSLDAFPIVTTRKINLRVIVHELIWYLSGSTNIRYLLENNVHIWTPWAYEFTSTHPQYSALTRKQDYETLKDYEQAVLNGLETGFVGFIYGYQWMGTEDFYTIDEPFDCSNCNGKGCSSCHGKGYELHPVMYNIPQGYPQLPMVIDLLKSNPNTRRAVVSAWNPAQLDTMALPPCHTLYQFKVYGNKISLMLYQRSADIPIGVPYNISEYALLLCLVASLLGKEPDKLIHTIGDAHIYLNQVELAKEQIKREPLELPKIHIRERESIHEFEAADIKIIDYKSHPAIKYPVAV